MSAGIKNENQHYNLKFSGLFFIILLIGYMPCNSQGLMERSGEWNRILYGEYLLENNTWNVQALQPGWSQTIFYDTLKGSKGWRWDFSGEKDELNTIEVKTFPEIIFGRKPYDGYESTVSCLPMQLATAQFILEYEYQAIANGVYNTSTDISFTDSKDPNPANIKAKMMIWFDHQNMPFFETEKLESNMIDGIQYKLYIDTTHIGPEGKWVFIALLPNQFPRSGVLNLTAYFNFFLLAGILKPEWYLSSIEVGSEISSGKGEVNFNKFRVHYEL
jgi:hypothetical protein